MLESMMPKLLKSGFEHKPRALATIVWSCGRLTFVSPDLLDVAHEGIRVNMELFNMKDLV